MARRLSINGVIFQGSREIDETLPFTLQAASTDTCPGTGDWSQINSITFVRNYEFIRRFPRNSSSDYVDYYMDAFCKVLGTENRLTCYGTRQRARIILSKSWVAPTPVSITPCMTPSNDCLLTINYEDGTSFEYGEVPCDAEVFLLDDICCPESIKLANKVISLL